MGGICCNWYPYVTSNRTYSKGEHTMELLKIEALEFQYPKREKKALQKISFTVKEGDFVVLYGTSGCGKTTLMRLIKKELAPHGKQQGTIWYDGCKLDTISKETSACEIGFLQQHPDHQIVTDKVWHELAFGLENLGVPNEIIRRRVGEMANYFGIHSWYHKNTHELSGGQKQLLNLASILVMQPRVLLLDEPTSQLDPIAATDFITTLQKLNEELGITIILSEHRLEEVLPVATKVAVLEEGKLIAYEAPRDMLQSLLRCQKEELLYGLPSAIRIFHGLGGTGSTPLTVKEGRRYLSEHVTGVDALVSEPMPKIPSSEAVIELKHVWFRYEAKLPDILSDVSLEVKQGEIFTILGGNGSGKTTLLQVIAGVNYAYQGNIKIFGKRMNKYKQGTLYKNLLTVLPQNPQTVFLKQTVMEDFMEVQKIRAIDNEVFEGKVRNIAKKLGLKHLLNQHPYDLSGGEQQKAALGKVLLLNPKILLLDEPTKGLDAYSKKSLGNLLKSLTQEGRTIVMVTHDIEFAAEVSDRCGLFFDKTVLAMDTAQQFFSGNTFYTTAANRIGRHICEGAILCKDIIKRCQTKNGVERYEAKNS